MLASWNALPGDQLYGTKLAFESTLLALTKPSLAASGTLSIKYTERRFSETKQLLADRHSVEGLAYLNRQVEETKTIIADAPRSTTQQELARTYLVTLQNVSVQLEQQKQIAIAQSNQTSTISTLSVPHTPSGVPTQNRAQTLQASPTQPPPGVVQTQELSQRDVQTGSSETEVVKIAQTQETISQTIQELETITGSSDQGKHGDNNEKNNQKGDNKEGQGHDNGKNGKSD